MYWYYTSTLHNCGHWANVALPVAVAFDQEHSNMDVMLSEVIKLLARLSAFYAT